MNLIGGDFGEEIAIWPAAGNAWIVVPLVEVAIAAHVNRCGVRFQCARDYAGLPLQEIADLGGSCVSDVPCTIDGLSEACFRGDTGGSEFAVVNADVGQIGDMQRHRGWSVLLQHRNRMSYLEPRRPVIGAKLHGHRTLERPPELITHTLQAYDGIRLKCPQ